VSDRDVEENSKGEWVMLEADGIAQVLLGWTTAQLAVSGQRLRQYLEQNRRTLTAYT
jgi:hypothetical protein